MVSDVATLGAAIVIARNARTIDEIERALTDAGWLINPCPTNVDYKAWQTANGRTPTTKDEDRALEAVQRMAAELKRMR